MISVTHDPMTVEWYDVAEDGQPIGCYGRTEEMGIIRWVAYDAQGRRLGEFGGRGAAQQAKAAVVGLERTIIPIYYSPVNDSAGNGDVLQ